MRIAGVWVNVKNPPSKKVLIEQALKTKKYYGVKDAKSKIEQEVKLSGLFSRNINKSKRSKKESD